MFKLHRIIPAAFALAAFGAMALPSSAGAVTVACGNQPRCFGVLSAQAHPLEIATAVPVNQVTGGTKLIGMTPANSARADFHVTRLGGGVVRIRFEPNGQRGALYITATSDVAGSRPTLEPNISGTAGSSHQLWRQVNVTDHGFRVYRNEANGLVLALSSDNSGTALRLRNIGLGTGTSKNFTLIKPF